MTPRLYIKIV